MDTVDVDAPELVIDPTAKLNPPPEAPRIPRQPAGDEALVVDDGLTERERQVLAFERQWWKHAGAKEQAIRDLFELSATRYYQLLNALLDNPAALAYDPVLVQRLRRLRATRSRARTGGRRS
ncbi:MAG: hypothetical protein V7603_3558 [Micromonosporaceae bacterium]|jgi:hypothetical protein